MYYVPTMILLGRLEDVVRVYDAVKALPELVRALNDYAGEHASVVTSVLAEPIGQSIQEFQNFEGLVEAAIELDDSESHTYLIKDTYKPELGPLKTQMGDVLDRIPDLEKQAARLVGLEFDKVVKPDRDNKNGYHLRVTRSNEKALRKVRGIITLETQKKGQDDVL